LQQFNYKAEYDDRNTSILAAVMADEDGFLQFHHVMHDDVCNEKVGAIYNTH